MAGRALGHLSRMIPAAFFLRDGDSFVATGLTRGPWSNDHQHGGPPGALLGRALEGAGEEAAEFFLARVSLEFLRPVPLTTLTVSASVTHAGKTVQRLEASLRTGTVELMRATALRVRRQPLELPVLPAQLVEAAPPESLPPFELSFFQHQVGYHRGVELRFAQGSWGAREVTVWMRATAPLVEGEEASSLQRTLLCVDAESGVCPPLPVRAFSFPNPDLVLLRERELAGGWLGMKVRSSAAASGVGLAESQLFDAGGIFGRAAQPLVVRPAGG